MRTPQNQRCAENGGATAAFSPLPRAPGAASPEPFPVRGGQRFPAGGSAPGAPSRAIHHPAESPLTSTPSRARRSRRRENRDRDREKRGGSWGGSAPGHRTGLTSSRASRRLQPGIRTWICLFLDPEPLPPSVGFGAGAVVGSGGKIKEWVRKGERMPWDGQSSRAAPSGDNTRTTSGDSPRAAWASPWHPNAHGPGHSQGPLCAPKWSPGPHVGAGIELQGGPHARWWL